MSRNQFIFIVLVLLLFSTVFAQEKSKQIDSLEKRFFSVASTDTAAVLKTGANILKNATSYQQKFKVLEKISETYFRVNNLNKSITYSFQAKEMAEKSGDPELMAQAYGSIANLYSYLNLTEKARPYLNQAITQIEKLPVGDKRSRLKGLSYLELGNLDFNDKNYIGANKNYRQSLSEFRQMKKVEKGIRYHFRRSLYNIGNSYYYLKQPDSAETYLDKALAVNDTENPDLKYYIYSTLAEVYTLRGNYRKAIGTLQAILKDPNFEISSLKAEVYLNLSRNYKQAGDKGNYTLYNDKHLALRDTIEAHERKAINTAFDVEQKDFSDSIDESKQKNSWLIFGIIAILVLSFSTVIYLNLKKKKEHARYLSVIEKLKNQVVVSQIQNIKTNSETEIDAKSNVSIPNAVQEEILGGLQKFESDESFRNPKLTLSLLAVELRTNPAYLSAVIKNHKDKNFNNYINELRIGYICRKIHTHRDLFLCCFAQSRQYRNSKRKRKPFCNALDEFIFGKVSFIGCIFIYNFTENHRIN